MKQVIIIGGGFAGLSAATFLAHAGWSVTLLEKQNSCGGRARKLEAEGFTFDMGPSWYWMPDVFERYFQLFGKKTTDYYDLKRLDPSYRVYWKDGLTDIPASMPEMRTLFEKLEPGSGQQLDKFLAEAEFKYEVGIGKLVHKPGLSVKEFIDIDLAKGVLRLDVFTSMKKHVSRFFHHPKLIQLMEFPVLFLGAMASDIPALYSLMNYADMKLGTWYPDGGVSKIAEGMEKLAREKGVRIILNADVKNISVVGDVVNEVTYQLNGVLSSKTANVVIGAADYHFVESLLPDSQRSYTEEYWNKRVMAPSCLLYYVGVNRKLEGISHHSLFFDADFGKHGIQIYKDPQWPEDPLFYVCAPSVTDKSVAPDGCENLFFLIPVAAGLDNDDEALRDRFFNIILKRYAERIGQDITNDIVFKRSYSIKDFKMDYNAFKGNAYGLANTLMQTAILKPSLKSKRIKNLFYAGQLTIPGPGVPPALISGEVVAREIIKQYRN